MLGTRVGTVKSRLCNALAALREQLGESREASRGVPARDVELARSSTVSSRRRRGTATLALHLARLRALPRGRWTSCARWSPICACGPRCAALPRPRAAGAAPRRAPAAATQRADDRARAVSLSRSPRARRRALVELAAPHRPRPRPGDRAASPTGSGSSPAPRAAGADRGGRLPRPRRRRTDRRRASWRCDPTAWPPRRRRDPRRSRARAAASRADDAAAVRLRQRRPGALPLPRRSFAVDARRRACTGSTRRASARAPGGARHRHRARRRPRAARRGALRRSRAARSALLRPLQPRAALRRRASSARWPRSRAGRRRLPLADGTGQHVDRWLRRRQPGDAPMAGASGRGALRGGRGLERQPVARRAARCATPTTTPPTTPACSATPACAPRCSPRSTTTAAPLHRRRAPRRTAHPRARSSRALAGIDERDGPRRRARPSSIIVYSGHGDVEHGEGFVMLDGEPAHARRPARARARAAGAPRGST